MAGGLTIKSPTLLKIALIIVLLLMAAPLLGALAMMATGSDMPSQMPGMMNGRMMGLLERSELNPMRGDERQVFERYRAIHQGERAYL